MDSVPYAFCEHVAALWKPRNTYVAIPVFDDSKWTFSRKRRVGFYIGAFGGEWKYVFVLDSSDGQPAKLLNLGELIQEIGGNSWKNVQLWEISPVNTRRDLIDPALHNVGDDLEKILNFASCLCNEPILEFRGLTEAFSCPKGTVLFRWLEEPWFSEIFIHQFQPIYNRLIEKQFSRRIPTSLWVYGLEKAEGVEFIREHLTNGNFERVDLKLEY